MATRSEVAVEVNGEWKQSYVHYDGYPAHMLKALSHTTTQQDAEALVSKGDIRYINDENGQADYFGEFDCSYAGLTSPKRNQEHLYVFTEEKGWTHTG